MCLHIYADTYIHKYIIAWQNIHGYIKLNVCLKQTKKPQTNKNMATVNTHVGFEASTQLLAPGFFRSGYSQDRPLSKSTLRGGL